MGLAPDEARRHPRSRRRISGQGTQGAMPTAQLVEPDPPFHQIHSTKLAISCGNDLQNKHPFGIFDCYLQAHQCIGFRSNQCTARNMVRHGALSRKARCGFRPNQSCSECLSESAIHLPRPMAAGSLQELRQDGQLRGGVQRLGVPRRGGGGSLAHAASTATPCRCTPVAPSRAEERR